MDRARCKQHMARLQHDRTVRVLGVSLHGQRCDYSREDEERDRKERPRRKQRLARRLDDGNRLGGKLKAAMNSPQSKQFTKLWVEMIQNSGPRNWATYTWYQVGTDLGAGASGMIYDADILGYFMDGGDNKERGHLAYGAFAANPAETTPTANVWIWSLAMSNFSKKKDAAWDFIQWATGTDHLLFGARKMDMVNPVRTKIWEDPDFKAKIGKYPGYLEQYTATAPHAKIYFTPQPLFFNLTTDWAAALQRMVAKEVPVDEGLDKLAESVNRQLKGAGLG